MKRAFSSSKLPYPPACRRKIARLFCSACRRKNLCVFALPVEEKACEFSLCLSRKRVARAHGALFPLPVEEKAIMGTWRALAIYFSPCLSKKSLSQDSPPQEAQERPFSEDSGRQRWPLANAFSPSETGKRQIANCFCLFAMAFSLYLRRKMQFQSSSGLNSTYLQTVSLSGLNPHGLKTVSSSSHVMRTCDGTNIFRVRWGAHWMPSYAGTTPTALCLLSDEPTSTI